MTKQAFEPQTMAEAFANRVHGAEADPIDPFKYWDIYLIEEPDDKNFTWSTSSNDVMDRFEFSDGSAIVQCNGELACFGIHASRLKDPATVKTYETWEQEEWLDGKNEAFEGIEFASAIELSPLTTDVDVVLAMARPID